MASSYAKKTVAASLIASFLAELLKVFASIDAV